MNRILFELKEFRPTITITELARVLWRQSDTMRSSIDRWRVKMNSEEKKIVQQWLDGRIRALIKIKLLLDKEIQW